MSDCLDKGMGDQVDPVRNRIMSQGFGVMEMEKHLPSILRNKQAKTQNLMSMTTKKKIMINTFVR